MKQATPDVASSGRSCSQTSWVRQTWSARSATRRGGILRWHDDTLRTQIGSHHGKVVHTTGDGFFASFWDAAAAASCAVAIQRRLTDHRGKHGFAPQVRDRVAIKRGDGDRGRLRGARRARSRARERDRRSGEILVTASTIASRAIRSGSARSARSRSRGSTARCGWSRSLADRRGVEAVSSVRRFSPPVGYVP